MRPLGNTRKRVGFAAPALLSAAVFAADAFPAGWKAPFVLQSFSVARADPGITLYPYGFRYSPPARLWPLYVHPPLFVLHPPLSVVTRLPFYCLTHHVGFVSRIGIIDHLTGAHRVPIDLAARLCPETGRACVLHGY